MSHVTGENNTVMEKKGWILPLDMSFSDLSFFGLKFGGD